ncbi:hypothetical protein [Streptomyces sp. NPDC006610]
MNRVALAFIQKARRRELCRPLDWIADPYHRTADGQAVVPDALLRLPGR